MCITLYFYFKNNINNCYVSNNFKDNKNKILIMNSNIELLLNKYLLHHNIVQQLVLVEDSNINKDITDQNLNDNVKMNKVFFVKYYNKCYHLFIYLDYYAAQRQLAAQRVQPPPPQQQEQPSHPVGIRVCIHLKCHFSFQ